VDAVKKEVELDYNFNLLIYSMQHLKFDGVKKIGLARIRFYTEFWMNSTKFCINNAEF
jgi:hypothetical protein